VFCFHLEQQLHSNNYMRLSNLLVLFALGLLTHGTSSDSCLVSSVNHLKTSGACKSDNVMLFSKSEEFTINLKATTGDLRSNMTLGSKTAFRLMWNLV
jgi:hypothetical protein